MYVIYTLICIFNTVIEKKSKTKYSLYLTTQQSKASIYNNNNT